MRGVPSDTPILRLQDIVDNIDAIEAYVEGLGQDSFR